MSAEIPDGAVIVARAILNSSLWKMRPADRVVAVTCLALCNKKPKRWFDGVRQIMIERGQFVRSRKEMADECCLPVQVVRTSLEHLEKSEFLTRLLTRHYTLYTVPKYEHYQDLTKYSDSRVLKPTQVPTRLQPDQTPKSNPEFAHSDARNPTDREHVAGVLTNCANFPTKQKQKTNHKQQQQDKRESKSESAAKPESGDPGPSDSAVVVEETGQDGVLEKIAPSVSGPLLESVKMAPSVASSFTCHKTVGQILRAVQQARLQKKPGGWARMALEGDWLLPQATGPEAEEVTAQMRAWFDRRKGFLSGKIGSTTELTKRKPGESEEDWFRRVNDDLKGRQSKKGTGADSGGTPEKST